MATDFRIEPYVGAHPILFGMGPKEVERLLSAADSVRENRRGERTERRGPINGLSIVYDETDGGVCEIGFCPGALVYFHGRDVLGEAGPLPVFLQFDPSPLECVGFLVFMELGVALTGYHDNDEAQRALTVFRKGRWDCMRGRLKPWGRER